jgi:hypothetical protein
MSFMQAWPKRCRASGTLIRYGHRVESARTVFAELAKRDRFVVLGLAQGHVRTRIVNVLIQVFVATSVSSTYLIGRNDAVDRWLTRVLERMRLRALGTQSSYEQANGWLLPGCGGGRNRLLKRPWH